MIALRPASRHAAEPARNKADRRDTPRREAPRRDAPARDEAPTSPAAGTFHYFCPCPRGLEEPLAAELQALGCTDVRGADGGVSCRGTMEQVYRINLWSRVASRVLLRLAKGGYRNEHDIYKLAKNIDWAAWFAPEQTFKVKVEGKRANVKSLDFVGLKIKDALCDAFREACGIRPSVDKARPDVRVHAFVGEREVQIFLDTSGEGLFKRGYRQDAGEAPLRENLAAGLLLLAGYDGTQPFQDPFCGSGPLAIEAARSVARSMLSIVSPPVCQYVPKPVERSGA